MISSAPQFPLVAVDVGNSRIKLGLFEAPPQEGTFPRPARSTTIETDHWEPLEIALWLAPRSPRDVFWRVASVKRPACQRLWRWLTDERADANAKRLTHEDLPLVINLTEPEQVGMDRLLAAVAAGGLVAAGRPVVVVDLGSAITVDVLSREGTFCGGAILPGIGMSARALHEFTDQLPDVEMVQLDQPPPVMGTSTNESIASGLYWGALGALRMLIDQLNKEMDQSPLIVLTGGAAGQIAEHLEGDVCYEPHLVLAGIVLAALA